MKKSLLSVLVAGLFTLPALAFEPFVVKDIRVEGIQRTEAGTVFGYLPVKVGETLTDEKAAQAIKTLFGTGFFRDVRIEIESGVMVVVVQERPAIAGPRSSTRTSSSRRSRKPALPRGVFLTVRNWKRRNRNSSAST